MSFTPTPEDPLDTHRLGRRFERLAEERLARTGWTVVDRNVRFRRKEVDLVMRRGRIVAFVEVKGRRGPSTGHPLEAITPWKRREIESVAHWWIDRHGRPGELYRFDAVSVRVHLGGVEVEHVEGAWRPGE